MVSPSVIRKVAKLYPDRKLYGPYIRSDNRAYFILAEVDKNGKIYKGTKRSSILRSRLMMEVRLKRKLPDGIEVDHKDGDSTNDIYSNLQVIDALEHKSKDTKRLMDAKFQNSRKKVKCPQCGTRFTVKSYRVKAAKAKGRKPCCSRSCASKYVWRKS